MRIQDLFQIKLNDEVIYDPHYKQALFHSTDAPYKLYGGAVGGGKSICAIWHAILTCLNCPGCDVLLIRQTNKQLEMTLINEFGKIPYQVYNEDNQFAYNQSDKVCRFKNGSKLWFGSMDSKDAEQRYLGSQLLFIGVDEATDFTYKQFDFLKSRNRSPIKQDIHGNPVRPQIGLFTNPGGPGHEWIKKLFIEKEPYEKMSNYKPEDYVFIPAKVYDNPTYANDQNYLNNLRSMSEGDRRRFLEGSWDEVDGAFFDCFKASKSAIDLNTDELDELINYQWWQDKWIGIDWGHGHHSVAYWCQPLEMYDLAGRKITRYIIYRELAIKGETETSLAQKVLELSAQNNEKIRRIYLSPECFNKKEPKNSRAGRIGDIFSRGMRIEVNEKELTYTLPKPLPAHNDRVDGWRLLYEMLDTRNSEDSILRIDQRCEHLLKSLPQLERSDKDREDVLKRETLADDCADALRYTMFSHPEVKKKPFKQKLKEMLEAIPDPNVRHIKAAIELQKHKQESENKVFSLTKPTMKTVRPRWRH